MHPEITRIYHFYGTTYHLPVPYQKRRKLRGSIRLRKPDSVSQVRGETDLPGARTPAYGLAPPINFQQNVLGDCLRGHA